MLLKKAQIKDQREWGIARYIAWASGKWKKGTKPKDLFELEIDTMYQEKYEKDEGRALAAFDKYEQLKQHEEES